MNLPAVHGEPYRPPISLREALEGARQVVLTAHVDPDPDALGCALGLSHVLRHHGWQTLTVCIGRMPSFAMELPGWQEVVRFPSSLDEPGAHDLLVRPGDALVVSDTPSSGRMAAFYEAHQPVLADARLINIDHHFTNEQFGTFNFVDPTAAATAEVVCDLLEDSGMEIDPDGAVCLLTALVADTQSFRTESTSPRSLLLAHRLYQAGASIYSVTRNIFGSRPISMLRLWGAALRTLEAEDGIAWVQVTEQMMEETGSTLEETEGLVDLLLTSKDVRVAVVLKQQGDETKVSLRTVPGIDATRITGLFGGGGHQRASGCTIAKPPAAAAHDLIPAVRSEVFASASSR